MAAPHPSSVNPGSSEDETQEPLVLVKASMVYGLLEVNHQLIRQIQHSLKLYNDLENMYQQKVAQFQSTACKFGDALNRSDSTVQVLTGQLANVTNNLQVAENLLESKDLEVKKINDKWKTAMSKLQEVNNAKETAERIVEVKASNVDDLESTIQYLFNKITICQEQTKAREDEIRDLKAVQEVNFAMLPKKVDTLTEAMDGIKGKIFASGPMEVSETNKNVNVEEDRGIQMLPKKVDTLTEAMDEIKGKIFASGPIEVSETNKNVNAEEDRGIQMLPKKVDILTEAMDGIKEKIFASGPMEVSETNKNVNAEEDRGIQILPKKVDILTEAMDGIKGKIFASGPMEVSETNKNVNAEEDRGIQVNINQLKA